MAVTVEFRDDQQDPLFTLTGELRPTQWWALADTLVFWGDIQRHMSFCRVNGQVLGISSISSPKGIRWAEQALAPGNTFHYFCEGGMVLPVKEGGDTNRLGAILRLATSDPLVAVKFSYPAKQLDHKQKARFEWIKSKLDGAMDGRCGASWFDFEGSKKDEEWCAYVVLVDGLSPIDISERIEEIQKAERSLGFWVRPVLIPRDYPILSELGRSKVAVDYPFYITFEPDDGEILTGNDVWSFATEEELKRELVGLLDHPSKKVMSSGKFPVVYEW